MLPGQSRITHIIYEKKESTQSIQINYNIHHGFTSDEKNLIKHALEIVTDRLFKPEILQNMYQICGKSADLLGTGVWARSKLENNQNYSGTYDLLRFQLMCLENIQLPTIHIYPIYEISDKIAEGTIGCISCISHGLTFSIEGNFQIKLNRYYLNTTDNNTVTNKVSLAGTIVHEMLHNLGHKHGDNDYSNQWQINLFEKCFVYNGNYLPE